MSQRDGQVVAGKYLLGREIGRGAMGSVWEATHQTLGQRVAIKFINREYAASEEARSRFDNEAKAAVKLKTRFAVQVFDHGETADGSPYIVMEFLEGQSLEDRLQSGGPMSLLEAVRYVSHVGKALARAHAHGIVHRDLKPANIFLAYSADDAEIIAKVLDFGVAKVSDEQTSNTRTGSVIGTPQFMSPEQVRGLRTVDHRTDLYALGMITYALLTGRVAYTGEAFGDLLLAICTAPLPSIHAANPALPPTLDGWFQTACAREPGARFQSAEQLVDALFAASGISPSDLGVSGSGLRHPSLPGTGYVGGSPSVSGISGDSQTGGTGTASGLGSPQAAQPFAPGAPVGTSPGFAHTTSSGTSTGGPARLLVALGALMVLGGLAVGGVLFAMSSGDDETSPVATTEPAAPTDPLPPEPEVTPTETAPPPAAETTSPPTAEEKAAPSVPAPRSTAPPKDLRSAARTRTETAAKAKAKADEEAAKAALAASKVKAAAEQPRPIKRAEPDVGF